MYGHHYESNSIANRRRPAAESIRNNTTATQATAASTRTVIGNTRVFYGAPATAQFQSPIPFAITQHNNNNTRGKKRNDCPTE